MRLHHDVPEHDEALIGRWGVGIGPDDTIRHRGSLQSLPLLLPEPLPALRSSRS